MVTSPLGYGIFDSDQHYYEPRDSFTRHVEPAFRDVAIHPVIDEHGREILASGDRRSIHDVKIFDEVARPGSLRELLKKFKVGEGHNDSYEYQPMQPEYQDRDLRLRSMDEQGVEATFMFNNNAILAQDLCATPEALFANLRSFNAWQDATTGGRSSGSSDPHRAPSVRRS